MALSNKSVTSIWDKFINPLRALTTKQIEWMLQQARQGNDLRLQLCYSLIEQYMPIFTICLKKRQSAVLARKWDIVPDNDSSEARAQAEKVKQMFEKADQRSEDSLTNAFEQLCLASFRGRAFTKPFIVDGDLLFKDV